MARTTLTVRIGASAPLVPKGQPWLAHTPFDVSHEMRLVKSALLYADRVVLVSPSVAQVQFWQEIAAGAVTDLADMTKYLSPHWVANDPRLLLPSPEIATGLAEGFLARIEREPSWVELREALGSGDVELGELPAVASLGFHPGTVLGGVIGFLADSLDPQLDQVPMLDESVSAAFQAAAHAGLFESGLPGDATEVAAANHLIAQIPAFPDATVDVVLDIRKELAVPLIGFRSAVGELAKEIDAQPTETDFRRELDAAFRRVVASHLQELEELAQEMKLVRILRREVVEGKGAAAAKAAITFAAAGAAAWPQLAQAAVGAAVAATDIASGAYGRYRQIDEKRRANKLLWLYEAERKLKGVVTRR